MHILKAEAQGEGAEFPPFLANHLPMILVALEHLGAPPDRVVAFSRIYRMNNGLVPCPEVTVSLTAESWMSALGVREQEGALRAFFTQEVARLGSAAAIQTYLPCLAPGIAGSAFHPLMRLSYAVMEQDEPEIGVALGYWAAAFLILDKDTATEGVTDDPVNMLVRAAALPGLAEAEPESDLVWHHMRAAARMPGFAGVADWLIMREDMLDRMAAGALALYAETMSFEALHALTGCHWLRQLCPLAPDMAPLLRHFWVGIAALMPKMGFPAMPSAERLAAWRSVATPGWDAIKQAAIASDDEHDISLCFSAFVEWQRTGDALYQVVAAKRMGLIG
ncbi:questin oxidase family protein [Acidisoma cellulosilytica]|uniref:Questin oxidase family protein n=1 Tax=Acidisoma cellulosilyticum TaxID=2802395 RepID=A0A964E550_9PROT|nr:questin oxidase family protein [Acidisoma cellulosilyticum]MCB8882134.1 questin oxidase family protein [Acidisoma cellulosilyticum]